jgi:hypothetical protein
MLIYVKKKQKTFYGRTDGQPKTIVRNLTKKLQVALTSINFRFPIIILSMLFL